MAENRKQENNRSQAAGLVRFFSVDSAEANSSNGDQDGMVTLGNFWSKEFLLKVVQLVTGFVCIGIYSEGLKFFITITCNSNSNSNSSAISSMMFPNTVFSCFVIITSVIILSTMLGCAMRDVLIRIFNILGMILYFAAATVILYESMVKISENEKADTEFQRKLLFGVSAISFFNSVVYAVDVYLSVKKAITFDKA